MHKTSIMLTMKKCAKKSIAFTLAEAMITLVIMGLIGTLVIPQIMVENPTKKGWDTLAKKMTEYLTQASGEILLYNSSFDDFTRIKDGDVYFSIEDPDVTGRISNLYKHYLSEIDAKVDTTKSYFSNQIKDFKGNPIGITVKGAYSHFFYVNDGMLIGFRLYQGCDKTETNTNPPTFREKYSVTNICGSIFYDINAYKKPNKLGSDQYIVPIGKRGIKYEDN